MLLSTHPSSSTSPSLHFSLFPNLSTFESLTLALPSQNFMINCSNRCKSKKSLSQAPCSSSWSVLLPISTSYLASSSYVHLFQLRHDRPYFISWLYGSIIYKSWLLHPQRLQRRRRSQPTHCRRGSEQLRKNYHRGEAKDHKVWDKLVGSKEWR